ncbi:MAG: hypothetical protein PHI97_21815 [Desulfobulbus sp.]|nr:hypothetical protein [Desulfobulbus sp.]
MLRGKIQQHRVQIHLPFSAPFLPLAMEFADKGARGFGYGNRETGGLVLAVEELFSFYMQQAAIGSAVEIELVDQAYRLALSIAFRMANPDLRAFNLTWRVNPDSDESLEMLGPMIAARSVSSLRLDFGADEQVVLRLSRNRDYAPASVVALPPPEAMANLRLADPSLDDLRHFAAMAATSGCPFLPSFLAQPGMAVDMFAAGHLHALLVQGKADWIMGGVLWRPLTDTCLELYGPYLFNNDPDDQALTLLLDEAVSRISRSRFRGIVRRQGPLAGHERFFDFLGDLCLTGIDGAAACTTYYYRQLKEESSGVVYCTGGLATFLGEQYNRLCLPRQLRETGGEQTRLRDASVLSVEMDHSRSLAIIRPLCAGKDMAANLTAHLDLLRGEGICNFIVEINTGSSEDTSFAAALEETGFVPRLLIPDAGLGDVVIYGHCARTRQS